MGEIAGKQAVAEQALADISLIPLLKLFWRRRILLAKIAGGFMALGLLIAVSSKVEYRASCKLMPESQESAPTNLGRFGGLAGLAGISLDLGGNGALTPELYPEIVQGFPFQWKILQEPVYYRKADTTISTYNFLKNLNRKSLTEVIMEYTLGLPSKIKALFISKVADTSSEIDKGLIELTKEDTELVEELRSRIMVFVDVKTGVISITAELPDPYAVAEVTKLTVTALTQEIIDYKVGKLQANLDFVEERFVEAKDSYETKQMELALYADRNKNINSSLVETEYQRLQNELNIAFEVYKGLATELEQAKIKVKEQTPVFTVLEPVRVPVDKSKPKRFFILGMFGFIGLLTSLTTIFFGAYWKLWFPESIG